MQTGVVTFLPPLAFALFYPRGFVMATGYAGVATAVLALLIPSMLAWQSRKQNPQANYRVAGCSGAGAGIFVRHCGDSRTVFYCSRITTGSGLKQKGLNAPFS